jgi:hypothetical protein
MVRGGVTTSSLPVAGDVDVDMAERALMNHRSWCGVPDGIACMGCRRSCIEAVAVLRETGRLAVPNDIGSFVQLREVHQVWHFDMADDDPDVLLVLQAFASPQCRDSELAAAKCVVAAMIRTDLLQPAA